MPVAPLARPAAASAGESALTLTARPAYRSAAARIRRRAGPLRLAAVSTVLAVPGPPRWTTPAVPSTVTQSPGPNRRAIVWAQAGGLQVDPGVPQGGHADAAKAAGDHRRVGGAAAVLGDDGGGGEQAGKTWGMVTGRISTGLAPPSRAATWSRR